MDKESLVSSLGQSESNSYLTFIQYFLSNCLFPVPAQSNGFFEALDKLSFTMSSINKVISKKIVSTIVKDGKSVVVSTATETSQWKRPDAVAEKLAVFWRNHSEAGVVNSPGPQRRSAPGKSAFLLMLRPWRLILVFRESGHKSDADKRDHITAVSSSSFHHSSSSSSFAVGRSLQSSIMIFLMKSLSFLMTSLSVVRENGVVFS